MFDQLVIEASFLGILQGITEFLPVSSSGHLVIAQQFFPRLNEQPLLLNIILHLGTLLAILVYFRSEIKKLFLEPKKLLPIICATIVTVAIVFLFKNLIRSAFISSKFAGAMLIVTAIILFFASQKKDNQKQEVAPKSAIKIGIAQALAVLPGISRSGMTISTGIFLGIQTLVAFRFSFLLAIPVMFGAGILELSELRFASSQLMVSYFFGFVFSFLAGFWAIKFLMVKISKDHKKLIYFSLYCFLLGFFVLFFL